MTNIIEKKINTLRYFNIENNSSWYSENPQTYDKIAAVITQNPNLQHINVSYNGYDKSQATALLRIMT